MQPQILDAIAAEEKTYWWFVARHSLVLDWLVRSRLSPAARVLDLGCGTGAMLERINAIAQAFGTDVSEVSLRYCRERGLRRLSFADGTHLPFADEVFEGVISLDVIEHIQNDASVFAELYRVCTKRAVVVVTVPALQWLWSSRDERLGHKRRYHRAKLLSRARDAGFVVEKCSYYCLTLFPIFAAAVFLQRLARRRVQLQQDVPKLPRWLNGLLLQVLLAEQRLMDFMDYPIGASLFIVLRKP